MGFDERFTVLDPDVWTASYLPAWSSRASAAAAWSVGADGLLLSIPQSHPLWCPDSQETPLRVSAIQSANRSGPVGSTDAPQPFRDGLVVREQQPTVLGFTPHFGTVAVTCSAEISPRSMFSAWMVGLEDRPDRCGEICLAEVFGDTVDGSTAVVGQGIHCFRDPALREDFSAQRRSIDITQEHTYAAHWRPGKVDFTNRRRRDAQLRSCARLSDDADSRRVRLPGPARRYPSRAPDARHPGDTSLTDRTGLREAIVECGRLRLA